MDFFKLKEQITPQSTGKTVVFTFGRFQPPTRGHQLVFDVIHNHAKKIGAEPRVYVSRTDPSALSKPGTPLSKRAEQALANPLTADEKHHILKKMYPTYNFVNNPNIKQSFDVLKHLSDDNVEHAIFVGEADRQKLADQMAKYAGTPDFPNIKKVSFIKSGDRDPDAEGVEGISGTGARAAAETGDHAAFHAMMPEHVPQDETKKIMRIVRHSVARTKMQIEQIRAQEQAAKDAKKKTSKKVSKKTKKNEDTTETSEILGDLLLEKYKRNYKKERLKLYGGKNPSEKQLRNRKKKVKRTLARRKAIETGKVRKGETNEVDHKNGNATDNSPKNLRVVSRHYNRSRNNNKWRK